MYLASQILSSPLKHGQTVNPSKKSEINLLVDLVGLSELLKLCLIDSVLLLDKKTKPKSHLKIYYPVVHLVEMVVVEVIHLLLGIIIKTLDSSLEISMVIPKDVNPINSHHVLITSTHQTTQIVQQLNTVPHLVIKHVNLHLD